MSAFLERKLKHPLADVVTPTTHNNPAEKAAQEEAAAVVDTSSPLDLCPIPVYPSVQEFKLAMSESEESEDDYDEEEGQDAGSDGHIQEDPAVTPVTPRRQIDRRLIPETFCVSGERAKPLQTDRRHIALWIHPASEMQFIKSE